jgi:hypothetical protein
VRKDGFMTVKAEFFNPAGQLEKVMQMHDVRKDGSGQWVADKMEMRNVLSNHSTIVQAEKRDQSRTPPDSVFTPSFLERN